MQDLFFSFDSRSENIYFLNWLRIVLPLSIVCKFWIGPNQLRKIFYLADKFIVKELKVIFTLDNNSRVYLLFSRLFFFLAIVNVLGLFPYIFTPSRHLVFTLFFSIPFWVGIQITGWVFSFNKIACHLVPIRTPPILIPFLVIIESLRNLIRPLTLAVRLIANMTAGHLLMRLLGSACNIKRMYLIQILIILVIIVLLILESAVALIQAYVFILLSSLYTVESIL